MDEQANPEGLTDEQMLHFYDSLVHAMANLAVDVVQESRYDDEADRVYEVAVNMGATARRMRDYYLRRIALGAEPGKAVRPERSEPAGQA